ncbi:MAG: hypothetical protein JW941_08865, partial [Candidatus Coatesbacteria bacterium]|nr:hypothetical protein [Candidatus Coatesbacteria bacterium]
AVHSLGDRVRQLLLRSHHMELFSGSGCALWASLGPPWARNLLRSPVLRRYLNSFFDKPTGLCRKAGTLSTLAGQISFSAIRLSINGRFKVDAAVFPPQQDCPLAEPFEIEVRAGRVTRVEQTDAGKRLEKWIEHNAGCGSRELMHFSFGLNPSAEFGNSILVNERVFGAVTVGIGFGAKNAHTDLVLSSPSVWIDQRPFLDRGDLVHPDLACLRSSLLRRT